MFHARQKRRQRSERLQVELSPDEIAAIDEFRYRARMPSRAAVVDARWFPSKKNLVPGVL
jgi:hypothetical protein